MVFSSLIEQCTGALRAPILYLFCLWKIENVESVHETMRWCTVCSNILHVSFAKLEKYWSRELHNALFYSVGLYSIRLSNIRNVDAVHSAVHHPTLCITIILCGSLLKTEKFGSVHVCCALSNSVPQNGTGAGTVHGIMFTNGAMHCCTQNSNILLVPFEKNEKHWSNDWTNAVVHSVLQSSTCFVCKNWKLLEQWLKQCTGALSVPIFYSFNL